MLHEGESVTPVVHPLLCADWDLAFAREGARESPLISACSVAGWSVPTGGSHALAIARDACRFYRSIE